MSVKSIAKWPAIFLAVIVLLYSIIPFVAGPVASYFLMGTGVKLVTLDLGYPLWKKIAIHNVVVDVSGVGRFELNEGLFEYDGFVLVFQSGSHSEADASLSTQKEGGGFVISNFIPAKIIPSLPLFDVALKSFGSAQYPGILTNTGAKHTADGIFLTSLFDGEVNGLSTSLILSASAQVNNAITAEAVSSVKGAVFSLRGRFNELEDRSNGTVFDVDMDVYPNRLEAIALDDFERVKIDADVKLILPTRIDSMNDFMALDVRGRAILVLYDNSESDLETLVNVSFGKLDADIVDGDNELADKKSADKNKQEVIAQVFSRLSGSVMLNRREALDFIVSGLVFDSVGQSLSFRLDSNVHHEVLKLFQLEVDLVGDVTSASFEAKVDSEIISLDLIDVSSIGFQFEELDDLGLSGVSVTVPKQSLSYAFEKQELSEFRLEYSALYAPSVNGGEKNGGEKNGGEKNGGEKNRAGLSVISSRAKSGGNEQGSEISGTVMLSAEAGAVSVNVNSKRMNVMGLDIPEYLVRTNIQYDKNLSASFTLLNACEQEVFSGTWSSIGGDISLSANQQFSTESSLQHWLNISGLPINLEEGSFSAEVALTVGGGEMVDSGASADKAPAANKELSKGKKPLSNRAPPSINISLKEGVMTTSFGLFENVQFSFSSLESESKLDHVYGFEGAIASANVGVPLEKLLTKGRVIQSPGGWSVDLSEARATIFDGEVELKQFPGDQGAGMRYALEFENIDLDKVVKTQDVKGLSTTGSISGGLPFTIEAGMFQMGLGKVQNYDGGIIRYLSSMTESADLHEQFKYTLKVLENFNYDLLDTIVSVEGENVMLKSNIVGRNPEFDNAQAIELNLNTELEWRPMLKYMRLQSGLKAALEDFVKAGANSQDDFNVCRLGGL